MDEFALVEVRFLRLPTAPEVMEVDAAAVRMGVPLGDLLAALQADGACETDGYAVRPHETLWAAGEGCG